MSVFNDQIKSKADGYAKSETSKSITAWFDLFEAPCRFYGMGHGSSLEHDNLI